MIFTTKIYIKLETENQARYNLRTEFFVSATRTSRDIKIPLSVGPRSEKFDIVSHDHGRTQKSDFGIPVCKTNFTDHHTPYTIMECNTWF